MKQYSLAFLSVVLFTSAISTSAYAQYFRRPTSNIDPQIMIIDETKVLGEKITPDVMLIDQNGREFQWREMLGKPTILVLAYYSCDGACSLINSMLQERLSDLTRVKAGDDYQIVTLSFDRHDNLKTTGAFKRHLDLTGPLSKHWTFATFKSEQDLKRETEKIGFKFFWVPEDRLFLHPGAFLFFSPQGRLVRILYQQDVDAGDVELAILDAKQGQFRPAEVINFAISLCYSYNYKDGKYALNIPLFVGLGALIFGLSTFFGSIILFRIKKGKQKIRDRYNAETA